MDPADTVVAAASIREIAMMCERCRRDDVSIRQWTNGGKVWRVCDYCIVELASLSNPDQRRLPL